MWKEEKEEKEEKGSRGTKGERRKGKGWRKNSKKLPNLFTYLPTYFLLLFPI